MYFIVVAWESKIASSLVSCLFLSTMSASHNQCYEFRACLCSVMLFIQYWLYTFHLHAHKHIHALLQAYIQKSTVWTLHTENTQTVSYSAGILFFSVNILEQTDQHAEPSSRERHGDLQRPVSTGRERKAPYLILQPHSHVCYQETIDCYIWGRDRYVLLAVV